MRIQKRVCRIAWTKTQAARVQRILSVAETSVEMDMSILKAILAHIFEKVDVSGSKLMGDMVLRALQGAKMYRRRICNYLFDRKKVDLEWHRRGAWYCTINIRTARNAGGLMNILANKKIRDILAFWDRLGIFNDPYPFPSYRGTTTAKRTYRGASAMWGVWLLDHFDRVVSTNSDVPPGTTTEFVDAAFSLMHEKRSSWASQGQHAHKELDSCLVFCTIDDRHSKSER